MLRDSNISRYSQHLQFAAENMQELDPWLGWRSVTRFPDQTNTQFAIRFAMSILPGARNRNSPHSPHHTVPETDLSIRSRAATAPGPARRGSAHHASVSLAPVPCAPGTSRSLIFLKREWPADKNGPGAGGMCVRPRLAAAMSKLLLLLLLRHTATCRRRHPLRC